MMVLAATLAADAQNKGSFEVLDMGNFKVHVYNSNDVMADASYIVEGEQSLVLMEVPLFKVNEAEFNAYVERLNKPIETVVSDYHLGGSHDKNMTMPQGMPQFVKGPVYGGMMKHFAEVFGDAMVDLPTAACSEVPFGTTKKMAGVDFTFERGASSDFPAASLIIGGKVFYTHWTPAKAHMSSLQISSRDAIDAEIAAGTKALKSGCRYFIGGHGGAANREAVKFKISYLKRMKRLVATHPTADGFVAAMKQAYPGLAREEELPKLAEALYK